MKSPFSRFFGSGEKEEPPQISGVRQQEIIEQVEIDSIVPNKYQPRTVFSEEKIEELARTIHTHGVIQPIVIRKINGNQYEIIAGERRYRAMKKLGWTEVPAIIRELDDKETASIALIENLQREELTAIEEAYAYKKLLELHSLTQEALAQRLGKGQSTVANKLRLLKLPEDIKNAIMRKELSERHARALIPLKDSDLQLQLYKEVIEHQLNVKQLENRIQQLLNPEEEVKQKKRAPRRKSVSKDVRIALNTIRQSLVLVTKSGIDVKTEEEDSEDFYTITVKIPKNK
ncbi:nucleoid occlusion protein [Sporosarcina limicola]|uniref:ParB family chromosome partitioning protein n=1 Tax=Sporosarcina limicola TaxID=34101 RepID=A0A927RGH2_9BACL|nr:nucleoid occlusion protein [Sporosarcina limicola]MBE1556517.1 ParB family chromosome partitioning protein [Sporosarcina limicola]